MGSIFTPYGSIRAPRRKEARTWTRFRDHGMMDFSKIMGRDPKNQKITTFKKLLVGEKTSKRIKKIQKNRKSDFSVILHDFRELCSSTLTKF